MLIYLPFTYFFILSTFFYKRRGMDICTAISCVFSVSTFCSIVLYNNPNITFNDMSKCQIEWIPTILFCILSTVPIIPFYNFNNNKRREVLLLDNPKIIDKLLCVYLFVFFISLYYLWDQLIMSFAMGLADARSAYYLGDYESPVHNLSIIHKLIFYSTSYIGGGAFLMIPAFFYSVVFLKKSKLYNFSLLFCSFSPIIAGMAMADRSNVLCWILSFILSYLIYRPYISKKTNRKLLSIVVVIFALLATYFTIVSLLRFEDAEGGALGSIIYYMGQSFLYFSDTWCRLDIPDYSFERVLPLSNAIFHHSEEGIVFIIEEKTGLRLNGFMSLAGFFLRDLGKFAAIISPLIIMKITQYIIKKNDLRKFTLSYAFLVYLFGIIPFFSVITYYYHSASRVFSLILFIYMCKKIKKQSNTCIS